MNDQPTEKKKIIDCLYSHFKDNTQKLKIVCDWDEVVQPHEPFALWSTLLSEKQKKTNHVNEKKEDKVKKLIFLSAYDKRKFPNGDPRKIEIFKETFGKFSFCSLQLIGFGSENQGIDKADWIKENATDFDVVIDDNPNICKKIMKTIPSIVVCAPHYLAVENQHHKEVLLIKTAVSDLDKKNFETDNY